MEAIANEMTKVRKDKNGNERVERITKLIRLAFEKIGSEYLSMYENYRVEFNRDYPLKHSQIKAISPIGSYIYWRGSKLYELERHGDSCSSKLKWFVEFMEQTPKVGAEVYNGALVNLLGKIREVEPKCDAILMLMVVEKEKLLYPMAYTLENGYYTLPLVSKDIKVEKDSFDDYRYDLAVTLEEQLKDKPNIGINLHAIRKATHRRYSSATVFNIGDVIFFPVIVLRLLYYKPIMLVPFIFIQLSFFNGIFFRRNKAILVFSLLASFTCCLSFWKYYHIASFLLAFTLPVLTIILLALADAVGVTIFQDILKKIFGAEGERM
jgi:hypothetical protein